MSNKRKLLVIIDPAHELHLALQRAINKSKLLGLNTEVCLLIGVDASLVDLAADSKTIFRDGDWLKGLTDELKTNGISYSFVHSWSSRWHQAVIQVAQQFRPDEILLPDYRENKKVFELSNEKWALLRNSSVGAVTIVRPDHNAPPQKILAAINLQKDNDVRYRKLNDLILKEAAELAGLYEAELHVINSYLHVSNLPSQKLVRERVKLPAECIHISEGSAETAIANCARDIEAGMVVIGNLARQGALAFVKGNTSEKILNKIETDVVVLS